MQFVHVHAEQCTSPPIACQARFSIQFLQGLPPAQKRGRKQSTYVIKNMFIKTQIIIYITSKIVRYIFAFALK